VSEVGSSDHIGFSNSGYDSKYVTTGIRSDRDWIRLLDFIVHCVVTVLFDKNGKHGIPESNACRNECQYKSQKRENAGQNGTKNMDVNTKANQEQMLSKIEASTKATREDIKCGQAEIRSIAGSIEEKIDAWIANMRDY
jgi:hypothetical protein